MVKEKIIATGVSGLDSLLGGGFMKGSSAMIVGEPGSGKSHLSTIIAYNLLKKGYTCIYIPVGEKEEYVKQRFEKMGYTGEGNLHITPWYNSKELMKYKNTEKLVLIIDSASAFWSLHGENKALTSLERMYQEIQYDLLIHTYSYGMLEPRTFSGIQDISDVIIEFQRRDNVPCLKIEKVRLNPTTRNWVPIEIKTNAFIVKIDVV